MVLTILIVLTALMFFISLIGDIRSVACYLPFSPDQLSFIKYVYVIKGA